MADLSTVMRAALTLAAETGELHLRPGGYWTPTREGEPANGGRHATTPTLWDLEALGKIVFVSQRLVRLAGVAP